MEGASLAASSPLSNFAMFIAGNSLSISSSLSMPCYLPHSSSPQTLHCLRGMQQFDTNIVALQIILKEKSATQRTAEGCKPASSSASLSEEGSALSKNCGGNTCSACRLPMAQGYIHELPKTAKVTVAAHLVSVVHEIGPYLHRLSPVVSHCWEPCIPKINGDQKLKRYEEVT